MAAHNNRVRPVWPHKSVTKAAAHASGQWAKKVRGKLCYFGPWADPDGALQRILDTLGMNKERYRVPGGLEARPDLTVGQAANLYLYYHDGRYEAKNLSVQQLTFIRGMLELAIAKLGRERIVGQLTPGDWQKLRDGLTGGPSNKNRYLMLIRAWVAWLGRHHEIRCRCGDALRTVPIRQVRLARKPRRLLTPGELAKVYAAAPANVRLWMLLALNAGLGAMDIALLPAGVVEPDGWLRFPRPKTGIARSCKLWPETLRALAAYQRPNDARPELLFITERKRALVHYRVRHDALGIPKAAGRNCAIDVLWNRYRAKAGVPTMGFYGLRHIFRSVADGAADLSAVRFIMGHADGAIDTHYIHDYGDMNSRIMAVVDRVREKLGVKGWST